MNGRARVSSVSHVASPRPRLSIARPRSRVLEQLRDRVLEHLIAWQRLEHESTIRRARTSRKIRNPKIDYASYPEGMRTVLWMAMACFVVGASLVSRAQSTAYLDPIPETTVDASIPPTVYQGGTVVARVMVRADGSVSGVVVIKPFPALTDPVVAALRQWRFRPARRNGRAVDATTTVAVQVVIVRT